MDLQQWLTALADELGVGDVAVDDETVRRLLDLARDAAHGVERVSAPLSTFLVGVAVGRGSSVAAATESATALLETPAAPGGD